MAGTSITNEISTFTAQNLNRIQASYTHRKQNQYKVVYYIIYDK